MRTSPIDLNPHETAPVQEGMQTQVRRVISGVPMFSADYDRQWRPNAIPPGGAIPDEWSWWEGPWHGQSCYHRAKLPYAVGDRLVADGKPIAVVEAVRVERLQDISEADAVASGVEDRGPGIAYRVRLPNGGRVHSGSARQCFASVWIDLHGEDSWIANPWVVVLTVAPVPAEDAVGRDALSTEEAAHGR